MSYKSKLDESYSLFKEWWEAIELNNYEKGILNKEIILFNQQLFRLKEKHLRIGVWGKAGVGKSSLLNHITDEYFFKTGILNGSCKKTRSKELNIDQYNLSKVELIDFPGFDICSEDDQREELNKVYDLDLILFIVAGDLNRNELENIHTLIKSGKKIILVLNKIDIWEVSEIKKIINNIRQKLPEFSSIPIINNSNKSFKKQSQNQKIIDHLSESIHKYGDIYIISNTLQVADKLSRRIKECRLLRRKKEAQATIGKFATMKASGVALNPLLFLDVAGCFLLDKALIKELSRIYGLKIKNNSVRKLIRTISINNIYLGATQISIISSLNFIRKISLISAPFTGGFSLVPYGPIAVVQAALAVRATKLIGKLAAKEILEKSKLHNLEPFLTIKNIALRGTNYGDFKWVSSPCDSKVIRDLSIFIP